MTHTPTPWKIKGDVLSATVIKNEDGREICDVWDTDDLPSEANAAFIVRAVNSHDKLVEALRYYASAEAWMSPQVEGPDGDYGMRARAALEGLE